MTDLTPEEREAEYLAHTLYNAWCVNECTLMFKHLPKIERDRWFKLADYLRPIIATRALREENGRLREALERIADGDPRDPGAMEYCAREALARQPEEAG